MESMAEGQTPAANARGNVDDVNVLRRIPIYLCPVAQAPLNV